MSVSLPPKGSLEKGVRVCVCVCARVCVFLRLGTLFKVWFKGKPKGQSLGVPFDVSCFLREHAHVAVFPANHHPIFTGGMLI